MDESWFQEAMGVSGLIRDGGLPWWQMAWQAAHAVIAIAYVVVIVNLMRLYARCKDNFLIPETYLYLSLLLIFGVMMHVDDVATYYWPHRWLFAGLKATAAIAAVWRLPSFVGAARHELKKAQKIDEFVASIENAARPPVMPRRELDERYELLRARVLFLEDLFRRNTWIHQNTLAMQHLNELLSEFETVLDSHPSHQPAVSEDAA